MVFGFNERETLKHGFIVIVNLTNFIFLVIHIFHIKADKML